MEISWVVRGLSVWKRGEPGWSISVLPLEVEHTLTFLTGSRLCPQAVHAGMRALICDSSQAGQSGVRTYFFSADTQEDMSAWVRAMNQAAQVLSRSSLKRSVPVEGPCQSAADAGGGPSFHRSLTPSKHCPLLKFYMVTSSWRRLRPEPAHTAGRAERCPGNYRGHCPH